MEYLSGGRVFVLYKGETKVVDDLNCTQLKKEESEETLFLYFGMNKSQVSK